jgi:hypothetical protein
MADSAAAAKPSSSVKLVLLGEAAVGKVSSSPIPTYLPHLARATCSTACISAGLSVAMWLSVDEMT